MEGEPLVLSGQEPALLCWAPVTPGSVRIRGCYRAADEGCRTYREGRDYVVDYAAGTVARTAVSSIPDFTRHPLYGRRRFPSEVPENGNYPYLVWVDYASPAGAPLAASAGPADRLPRTQARLRRGGRLKLLVYGDSIAAGAQVSQLDRSFVNRYAADLMARYPEARIEVINAATAGDESAQGVAHINERVVTAMPDLVLLAFGMNDQKRYPHRPDGVAPAAYAANLRAMVEGIRANSGAEVVIVSACPPHPDWQHTSGSSGVLAAAARRVADEEGCAFADAYAVWMRVLERKDASSLLGNNINHPNDFGHWLYVEALRAAGL
jgi:lysophospholipase L1-like esterase